MVKIFKNCESNYRFRFIPSKGELKWRHHKYYNEKTFFWLVSNRLNLKKFAIYLRKEKSLPVIWKTIEKKTRFISKVICIFRGNNLNIQLHSFRMKVHTVPIQLFIFCFINLKRKIERLEWRTIANGNNRHIYKVNTKLFLVTWKNSFTILRFVFEGFLYMYTCVIVTFPIWKTSILYETKYILCMMIASFKFYEFNNKMFKSTHSKRAHNVL